MQLTVQQALQLLELQPGATKDQIRAAYKRLALKYHPDKQKQHHSNPKSPAADSKQQPRHPSSSSSPQESAASFSLLSAAYQLLTGSAADANFQHTQQSSSSHGLPSFEAAYASGSLFADALIDEAVLFGLAPFEVAYIEQLVTAAAAGRLAEAIAQQPPTAEDEQLWRQLYNRITIKWQVQQQQQQQQQRQRAADQRSGGLLAELLSDVLLRPVGDLMVELSEEDPEDELDSTAAAAAQEDASDSYTTLQAQQQQQQRQQELANMVQELQQQGQSQLHPQVQQQFCSQQVQQHHEERQQLCRRRNSTSSNSSSSRRSSSDDSKRRQRHTWGFYWTWLRRLVVARAVASILLNG